MENISKLSILYSQEFLTLQKRYDFITHQLAERNWPMICIQPDWGYFISFLCRIAKIKTALEIGTLAGYSASCLLEGMLEHGHLICLERNPDFAELAHENLTQFGYSEERFTIILGDAREKLAELTQEGRTFDLIFLDADKPAYPLYLEWMLKLSHNGTVWIADNVLSAGRTLDTNNMSPAPSAMRTFLENVTHHPELTAFTLPFHDGLTLVQVNKTAN